MGGGSVVFLLLLPRDGRGLLYLCYFVTNHPGSCLKCSAFHSEGQGGKALSADCCSGTWVGGEWEGLEESPSQLGARQATPYHLKAKEHCELHGYCVKVMKVGRLSRPSCQSVWHMQTEPQGLLLLLSQSQEHLF